VFVAETVARWGILGGSGLYDMAGLDDSRELRLTTPFGEPSDAFRVGRLEGTPVAFLARHGRGHHLLPTDINYRANIHGFKQLGVERVISASAVGSLQETIRPREVVLPDQFFDRTRHRADTFFGRGLVAHVSMADPVCPQLLDLLEEALRRTDATVHRGGTYLCMEGPQFSTRAESLIYRSWGASVIGMTNLQEARLCREAEICYATLALVTDDDSWRNDQDEVVVDELLDNLHRGARTAQAAIRQVLRQAPVERSCGCGRALAGALLTDPAAVPEPIRRDLELLVGRYLSPRNDGEPR
jgi:5'-methylthioadenosine phosphorylase